VQWNGDASALYGLGAITGSFYSIPVTSSGFGSGTSFGNLMSTYGRIHFEPVTKYIYHDGDGVIVNPTAGVVVGKLVSGLVPNTAILAADASLGKAFILGQTQNQMSFNSPATYTLTSFDIQRFTPIASVTISNVVGTPKYLIRWGPNGLAFVTVSGLFGVTGSAVYILSGSFIGPAPAPSVVSNGVMPVDSPANTIQPGEWVSIYGNNLSTGAYAWNGDFPVSIGGTSVTIDGKPAYLSYVGPTQINLQVPNDTATGPVSVVVTTAGGTATSTVTLAPVAPSFFLLDSTHVAGIIVRTDGSGAYGGGTYDILGPTGNSLGYRTVAAKAGDVVELYGTGFGPTNPAVPAGQTFSGTAPTTNPVNISIAKVNVPPSFAGLSGAGLVQINLTIPAGLGTGDVPLAALVGGVQTQSGVVISLQ
jgi:uncharacterized protein (TIGR03437 family)